MMRILMLNYEFPPLGGGAGTSSYNLARELVKQGHQVDVLTASAAEQQRQECVDGINVYRVTSWRKGIHDSGFRGALTYVANAVPTFMRLTSTHEYDAIHYFFSLPTGVLSLLPGSHRRIPYVVSLRGSDVPDYDPYNSSLQSVHRLLKPLTRRIWRGAAQVVALSDGLKAMAQQTDPGVDFAVVPNGVDSEAFHQLPHSSSPQLRLVSVSRLVERKGIQHVMLALAEILKEDPEKAIRFTIVGEGHYDEALRELRSELQLEQQVSFHGYCAREALPELFADQDVFVLPSVTEAFGQAFVEAMSCGMPIIGGRVGGVVDIVGPENGILVEPKNVDQIKAAILALYSDPDRYHQMGENNRRRVVTNYSWASVAKQYLGYYQRPCPAGQQVLK